jgi:hypothetical protein
MCEATRLPVGDTAGMTADEFMDQTLVICVRDGAGQVSIPELRIGLFRKWNTLNP